MTNEKNIAKAHKFNRISIDTIVKDISFENNEYHFYFFKDKDEDGNFKIVFCFDDKISINSDPVFFEIPEKLFFLGFHSLKNIFPKIKIDES
jgi:hypothetical protein